MDNTIISRNCDDLSCVDITILYPWHKTARTRKAERIAKTAAREGNFYGISHVYGMVSCGLEKGVHIQEVLQIIERVRETFKQFLTHILDL
jgi:hypothetical protein